MRKSATIVGWSALVGGLTLSVGQAGRRPIDSRTLSRPSAVTEGSVTFDFSPAVLDAYGVWFTPRGDQESTSRDPGDESEEDLLQSRVSFPIDPGSEVALDWRHGTVIGFTRVSLASCGALMLFPVRDRVVIGNLTLGRDARGGLHIYDTLNATGDPPVIFDVEDVMFSFRASDRGFQVDAELVVAQGWANDIGVPEAAGQWIGAMRVAATLTDFGAVSEEVAAEPGSCAAAASTSGAASTGPDVIVGDLQSVQRYPTRIGDITAYAVGTTSCNVGTERVNWHEHTTEHPVIIQNIHRLDARGFQQIGMSWMKHGFYAVSQNLCSPCTDPTNGTQLGVGCSDPYSAPLNGDQSNMSPRATLNAYTGVFPYPWLGPGAANAVSRRVQIHDADLDPELNPGARYFIEGHYLTADDAAAGNGENNASYRQVLVYETFENGFEIIVDPIFQTRRGQPAVRAWKDLDPEVTETDVHVPGEGLLILAAKVRTIEGGWYRYQYALQNLNSDRSARSFSLELPDGAVVQNLGFRDIDHHSGEPFSSADWTSESDESHVAWSTQAYAVNSNANALRFSSVFAFSFDCNVEPGPSKIVIGLFKPGFPGEIVANSVGPHMELVDCNDNEIADACDIDCKANGCDAECGGSFDCNANLVPDECEPDCDANGVADQCDLAYCPPGILACGDCNGNTVPDGCETDCDHDGIPDTCEETLDVDGDGVEDCQDECPLNTPPGACAPPAFATCRFNTGFCASLPWSSCLEMGGTPVCGDPPEVRCQFGFPCPESYCKYGCRVGDADLDGDVDLFDVGGFQNCFSDDLPPGSEVRPSAECLLRFDFDEDADVDLSDFKEFCGVMDR